MAIDQFYQSPQCLSLLLQSRIILLLASINTGFYNLGVYNRWLQFHPVSTTSGLVTVSSVPAGFTTLDLFTVGSGYSQLLQPWV